MLVLCVAVDEEIPFVGGEKTRHGELARLLAEVVPFVVMGELPFVEVLVGIELLLLLLLLLLFTKVPVIVLLLFLLPMPLVSTDEV